MGVGPMGTIALMLLGVRAALVDGLVVHGDVEVLDGSISRVGVVPAGRRGMAVPGFVDLQVNGFAGVDFLSAGPDGYDHARAQLVATGVTSFQPTFVSSPEGELVAALGEMASAQRRGSGARILGAHLEGPFLSPAWAGAHDPAHMAPPDLSLRARR